MRFPPMMAARRALSAMRASPLKTGIGSYWCTRSYRTFEPRSEPRECWPLSDRYQQLIETPPGRFVSKQLGLPRPERLRRYEPGQPLLQGPALVDGGGVLLGQ